MDYHFLARFHVRGGQEAVAHDALAEVGRATRKEKGCLYWYGFSLRKDPSIFIITSSWPDRATFDVHADLPHTKKFTALMRSIVDREPIYEGGDAVIGTQE